MYASVMKNSDHGKILTLAHDRYADSVGHNDRTLTIGEAERVASIGRMACFISHDLRHPLSIICANLEFLKSKDVPSDRIEPLHEVQEAVEVMNDLIVRFPQPVVLSHRGCKTGGRSRQFEAFV